MKKRKWFLLLCVYIIFLVIGGIIFMIIESSNEIAELEEGRSSISAFIGCLRSIQEDRACRQEERLQLFSYLRDKLDLNVDDFRGNVTLRNSRWTFVNAFFFAFTTVTTIGYGDITPRTSAGRMFCLLYSLIGIPVNGLLLAHLSSYFTHHIVKKHQKLKQKKTNSKFSLWADTLMYLVPGFMVFLFFPATIFSLIEGWTYDKSVYFSFISLATIGYGDYVAGDFHTTISRKWLYKIGITLWILFGLGYFIMVVNFITQALRSQNIKRLEKKVKSRILWIKNEMVDIKKIANAIRFTKVKTILVEQPAHKNLRRSSDNIVSLSSERVNALRLHRTWSDSVLRRRNIEVVPEDSEEPSQDPLARLALALCADENAGAPGKIESAQRTEYAVEIDSEERVRIATKKRSSMFNLLPNPALERFARNVQRRCSLASSKTKILSRHEHDRVPTLPPVQEIVDAICHVPTLRTAGRHSSLFPAANAGVPKAKVKSSRLSLQL